MIGIWLLLLAPSSTVSLLFWTDGWLMWTMNTACNEAWSQLDPASVSLSIWLLDVEKSTTCD